MSELRQTAMQEMIEWAISLKHNQQQCTDLIVVKSKAEELLAMEKDQIAKAWDAGFYGYFSLGIREIEFNNGEEYYNINYNKTYTK